MVLAAIYIVASTVFVLYSPRGTKVFTALLFTAGAFYVGSKFT